MKTFSFSFIFLLFWVMACSSCNKKLSLEPPNTRPVYTLEVGDAAEIELLRQQLGLEVVHAQLPLVYFYGDKQGLLVRLADMGYAKPKAQNLDTVYIQYAKLVGKYNAEELSKLGVKMLNHEKDHWVVYGNLSSLKVARDKGYSLEKLNYEPRPREIEIRVNSAEDVQKIAGLQVDIISVQQLDKEKAFIVQGTAYDAQIDALKKLNFTVIQK